MEIDLLRIFLSVTNKGSFAAVAKERNVDPSSISRAIASLEGQLGTRLFQRTTRTLTLTEAGHLFLARAKPICDELEIARDELASFQKKVSGKLRISTSVAFGQTCLLPYLPRFRDLYPDLQIDLKLSDQNLDLISNEIDLAIRLNPLSDNRFIRSRLKRTRYRVVAAPNYLSKNPPISTPADLERHECLLFDLPQYQDFWNFKDGQGKLSQIPISGNLTMSNALAIKESTLRGLGIALLADWMVEQDIEDRKLVDLFPNHEISAEEFDTGIWIIYPDRAFLPSKTRVMIDFLKDNLK